MAKAGERESHPPGRDSTVKRNSRRAISGVLLWSRGYAIQWASIRNQAQSSAMKHAAGARRRLTVLARQPVRARRQGRAAII